MFLLGLWAKIQIFKTAIWSAHNYEKAVKIFMSFLVSLVIGVVFWFMANALTELPIIILEP